MSLFPGGFFRIAGCAVATGLAASHAGGQSTGAVTASAPAAVIALRDTLHAYPRVMRTSEGDTTRTAQAMSSYDGCRVVLSFEETGEDWKVVREVHADLGQLEAKVDVDRETEDRDIENSEDTISFPWRLKVHTKSGAKSVEVQRADARETKPAAPATYWVDRIEFLVPTEVGEKAVSKSLTAAITACSGGLP